jgi:hypothetical protein
MTTWIRFFAFFLGGAMLWNGCAIHRTPPPEPTPTAPAAVLQPAAPIISIETAVEFAKAAGSRLPANYIRATLQDRESDAQIVAAFPAAQTQTSLETKQALLRALERKFIHDPKTSGLDVLGPELSQHFREFNWQENDFPGGPEGPNEQFADVMVDTLDLVRPERRANSTREAVVLRAEATEAAWNYITNQWAAVPGQERWKLNRHALNSFVRLREQAKAEGVELRILSAHRNPLTAQRNAARAANPNAVASFSSHSLGLAVDFQLSHGELKLDEATTRPMSEVVRMRESPVHKWLLLRGEEFGWYPYQNEPWHWEYNPPGFREIYWADFPGGAPERATFIDEP